MMVGIHIQVNIVRGAFLRIAWFRKMLSFVGALREKVLSMRKLCESLLKIRPNQVYIRWICDDF